MTMLIGDLHCESEPLKKKTKTPPPPKNTNQKRTEKNNFI